MIAAQTFPQFRAFWRKTAAGIYASVSFAFRAKQITLTNGADSNPFMAAVHTNGLSAHMRVFRFFNVLAWVKLNNLAHETPHKQKGHPEVAYCRYSI